MRILWHSSSPECWSGYGIVTRELINRLRADGHFLRVGTKHEYLRWKVSDGLEIFEGTDVYLVNRMLSEESFDYIFTFWDIWILHGKRQFPKEKWIAYVPINTNKLFPIFTEILKNTSYQIAKTQFGLHLLQEAGFDALYAPHGIHTEIFAPDRDMGRQVRAEMGWTDENFVIGSVGLNYQDDVKGFIPLMRAFKLFHDKHPEARLFLCTLANERGAVPTHNYSSIAESLEIDKFVGWPYQPYYFMGRMTAEDMRGIYNAMDIFCLPTHGESFGLPIVEAQSCGIPVIVTNTTACPELCKTGWLIDVDYDDMYWSALTGVWCPRPSPSAILEKMEEAYQTWLSPDYAKLKEKARLDILEYDWNIVWPKYFKPIFQRLEDDLKKDKKQ